jgi:glycosyltransferase involved in cell wall biosynthesis
MIEQRHQSLTVGLDGYNLALPQGTGIATYGFNLANVLTAGGHLVEGIFGLHVGREPHMRETLFFDGVSKGPNVRTIFGGPWQRRARLVMATVNPWLSYRAENVPLTNRVDKEAFTDRIPAFVRLASAAGLFPLAQRHFSVTGRFLQLHMEQPPEIMHWTYPVPVTLAGARNIYTIHDLVPLRLPYTTLGNKMKFRRLLDKCVDMADHLCTISDFSRNDIIDQLGVDAGKITNTYQTAILPTNILAESAEASAALIEGVFELKREGYFLYFGAFEPKKNISRLVEAFLGLQLSVPLVLIGPRAWLSDEQTAIIRNHNSARSPTSPGGRIIVLEYLPRELLLRLIRSARAVLFPSISEGFGMPVLEAMVLGTPVLTSNREALAEISGDGALLVNPYDVGSIANGIRLLDSDDALREMLSKRGPQRAEFFSPASYLARLQAMYAGSEAL